jgi:tetratricopeptide (TPR) repeat protein
MFRLTRAASALLLSALIGLQLHAQEIQRTKPGDDHAKPSAESGAMKNRKRALALLDQLLEMSSGFVDAQLKIEIQAEIADVLWPCDERRARRMFEEAFRGVDGMKLPHLEGNASSMFIAGIKSRVRTEMLRKISRRDRGLAETLAKSIEQSPANESEPPACLGCRNQDESSTQQLQVASATIDIDSARAAQLAKAGLSKGYNPMIFSVLQQMRRKDPVLADELFVYALSVARRHTTSLSESFGSLFSYVLPELGTGLMKRIAAAQPAAPPANPAMILEFLSFVHDGIVHEADALQSSDANAAVPKDNRRIAYDYFIGEQTLGYFDRYLPDRTSAVRARLEDILRAVPPEAARQYFADFKRDREPEAPLNQAKTETDAAMQQSLYHRAITDAYNAQDFDQSLALIPKLDNEAARFFFESQIRNQRALVLLTKGDFDAAYEYANEVPDVSMRALLLGRNIALELFYKKETQRAAQMLAEAEALFQRAESGAERAKAMVELVYASVQIDPDRGFEDMRLAVEAINAANFAPHWISFKGLISEKTGKPFVRVDVGLDSLQFDAGFGQLARHDFDRALQLARMIASKEVSVLAQLAVCRIALDQMPASSPLKKTKEKDQPPTQKRSL